jgi:hypothetical protein
VHTGRVDWIGIAAVLVIGTGVVAYGYLWDRATNRRRNEALSSPPDRPVPGLAPDAASPAYVLPQSLDAKPAMDPEELAAIRAQLDAAPSLPHGHGTGAFATDHDCGLAVLHHPLIVIVDGDLTSLRELLPVAKRAVQASRPLVVIAARIANEVFQTLETNTLARTVACVAVAVPDSARRAHLAELTDAAALTPADLKMGWVPDESLGTCNTWVSSPTQLWVLSS